MLFQIFNVFNARSDDQSVFVHLFTNRWLWAAAAVSVVLQFVVVYVPFLQNAFGTAPLSARDWLFSVAVASSVLWLREASKVIARPSPDLDNFTPANHADRWRDSRSDDTSQRD